MIQFSAIEKMYIFLNDRKKSKYITIVQTLFHHLIAMKDKNML